MDRRDFLKLSGAGAFAWATLSARDVLAQDLCDPRHVLELDAVPGWDHRLVKKPFDWGLSTGVVGVVEAALVPDHLALPSHWEGIFDSEGSGRRMVRWKGLDRAPRAPQLAKELQMIFRVGPSSGGTAWIFWDTCVYEGRDFTMWESLSPSFSIMRQLPR